MRMPVKNIGSAKPSKVLLIGNELPNSAYNKIIRNIEVRYQDINNTIFNKLFSV